MSVRLLAPLRMAGPAFQGEQMELVFADNSEQRFPADRLLRDFNFVIVARPRTGDAVWRRGKLKTSERKALERVARQMGWRIIGDQWVHEYGFEFTTFAEVIEHILEHQKTKPVKKEEESCEG